MRERGSHDQEIQRQAAVNRLGGGKLGISYHLFKIFLPGSADLVDQGFVLNSYTSCHVISEGAIIFKNLDIQTYTGILTYSPTHHFLEGAHLK